VTGPREKRARERREGVLRRREEIVRAAQRLFDEKGIEAASIAGVAELAEVGVASVYRHFGTKADLAVAAGISYCRRARETADPEAIRRAGTGLRQLTMMLDLCDRMFRETPDFIRFLQSFDFFFANGRNRSAALSDFEREISWIPELMLSILKTGTRDGSLRRDINARDTAVMIMRTWSSLAQRLLTRNHVLVMDESLDPGRQLRTFRDMVTRYVAAGR
jgi:TetR/AcrR family transcriptional regulator, cholesterol catabolism regulator